MYANDVATITQPASIGPSVRSFHQDGDHGDQEKPCGEEVRVKHGHAEHARVHVEERDQRKIEEQAAGEENADEPRIGRTTRRLHGSRPTASASAAPGSPDSRAWRRPA